VEEEIRVALVKADGEAECVEDFDFVSALFSSLDEAAGGVALG